MKLKGAFVLFPVILTIILADCVGGGVQLKDCGTDTACFYTAVSVCNPAKITTPYENLSLYLETRQATNQCQLFIRVISGPASATNFINKEMLCPIPSNWANLTFSEDFLNSCTGTLVDELRTYLYYQPPTTCSDGTSYGACSSTKPQYCDNGVLINKCTTCGCASGQSCNQASNTCYVPQQQNQTNQTNLMIVSESINPIYGNAPLAVSVYVNATGGKQAYTYSWDFGDGSSIVRTQSNTLNHIYTQPGDYNPSCTVYDASTPPLQATGATTTIRVT